MRRWPWAVALVLATLIPAPLAVSQPSAIHKTVLLDQPFPAAPLHTTTIRTLVDAGGTVTPHTHPGAEMAYVLAGQALVTITGDVPKALAAGDSFTVAPGVVHSVKNVGAGPLTIVSTYVVDQTKPISSPAP